MVMATSKKYQDLDTLLSELMKEEMISLHQKTLYVTYAKREGESFLILLMEKRLNLKIEKIEREEVGKDFRSKIFTLLKIFKHGTKL